MDDVAGPSDLEAHFFQNFRGQRLATPISDFQQALQGSEIISDGGEPLAQFMTHYPTGIGQCVWQSDGKLRVGQCRLRSSRTAIRAPVTRFRG